MWLTSWLDGRVTSTLGSLLMHQTPVGAMEIKKVHEAEWLALLEDVLGEEITPAHERDKPVPVTFHVDHLDDLVSDLEGDEEPWVTPYLGNLKILIEDAGLTGIGFIFVLRDRP